MDQFATTKRKMAYAGQTLPNRAVVMAASSEYLLAVWNYRSRFGPQDLRMEFVVWAYGTDADGNIETYNGRYYQGLIEAVETFKAKIGYSGVSNALADL